MKCPSTHSPVALLGLALSLFSAGCTMSDLDADLDSESLGSAQGALDNAPQLPSELDTPRGTKVVMDPGYELELFESQALGSDALAAEAPVLIYMNRLGGNYTPGGNNSATNRSSLIQQSVSIPPASFSDSTWQAVMTCVRGQFAAFNVEVTDVDPGNVPHIESVVAGHPSYLGMSSQVGGVSPFTSNCAVIPNSIVFSFAANLPADPQIVCEVATQEIAHSFGLDHEYLCSDPMTYLRGCGAKSFQNVLAPCGEGEARACRVPDSYDCGYTQQNSVQLLTQRIGLRPDQSFEAAISSPVDGAVVPPGFSVSVEASMATSVELLVDGISVVVLNQPPFLFRAPDSLDDGTHVVEIVAQNGIQEARESIAVTVQEGAPDPGGDNGGGGGDGTGPDGTGPTVSPVIGGCTAGGNAADGGVLALVVLGIAAVWRRRRA